MSKYAFDSRTHSVSSGNGFGSAIIRWSGCVSSGTDPDSIAGGSRQSPKINLAKETFDEAPAYFGSSDGENDSNPASDASGRGEGWWICIGCNIGLQGPGEGVGDGPASENVKGETGRRYPGETAGDEKSNDGAEVAQVEAGE